MSPPHTGQIFFYYKQHMLCNVCFFIGFVRAFLLLLPKPPVSWVGRQTFFPEKR